MLTDELGLGPSVSNLVAFESTRWDGKGFPGGVGGEEIPMGVRIAHIARDAAFQLMLGDPDFVTDVINQRAAHAFDPIVARTFTQDAAEILDFESEVPLWDLTLGCEPKPWLMLDGEAIDRALAAMGHFTDMAIPEFVGHSSGVATTCLAAARVLSFDSSDTSMVHRAALRARPGTGRGPGSHLEQERILDTGRLGANTAARLPNRANTDPVPLPLRSRPGCRFPS